jgi:hypothetical protein
MICSKCGADKVMVYQFEICRECLLEDFARLRFLFVFVFGHAETRSRGEGEQGFNIKGVKV